jgi:ribosomal protein S18 acetylase RimI-like enzyme
MTSAESANRSLFIQKLNRRWQVADIEALRVKLGVSQVCLLGDLYLSPTAGEMLPARAPKHPELKIERVATEAHLQAYSDVNCAAYGFPLEWGRVGLGGSRFWRETAHTYLGYEKNDPVSAASVVVHNDYLYLALVATKPGAQKKGFAETMVRHVLQRAHEATGL